MHRRVEGAGRHGQPTPTARRRPGHGAAQLCRLENDANEATAAEGIAARRRLGSSPVSVVYKLSDDGMVTAVEFERWGDPDGTASWHLCPFGFSVTRSATFGGVTILVAGRAGWYYGTDRWPEGEFFRLEISGYELITGAEPAR